MATLSWIAPGSSGTQTAELTKRITSIGSGADNDLVVADPAMEATHALVRVEGGAATLQVLGSSAAVVNGRRRMKHDLEHADEIVLGGTRFQFRLFAAPAPSEAARDAADKAATYRAVLDLSRRLLGEHVLNSVLEMVMDSILNLTRADKGFLMLVDTAGELHVRVARNVGPEGVADGPAAYSDSIVASVLRDRRPLIVADALSHGEFSSAHSVVNLRLCSVLCVPLLDRDDLIGLLYVGNDNVVNLFTEAHLEAATIFAAQASLILSRAIAHDELVLDNARLREQLDSMRFGQMIGSCDAMRAIWRRVEKVAATDVSVLVLGETGTGKELVAREIHERSERRRGPFVTINCGAIPENLLESELFGHVRGAFTGATTTRAGKFQAADGGTLFLDEIGEMPLNLQVKILRALQDRTVTRVGESRPERVDLRVVAATHRDLTAMVAEGTFREDLYYRLNVVAITLPALRDRGDDIELIARFLLDRFTRELGTGKRTFARDALVAIRRFAWPGNVRQLENHIKQAIILCEGTSIHADDLALPAGGGRAVLPLAEAREEWQRSYISEILALNQGNRTKTARDLGVDPRTIFRFLEKEGERDGDES